MNRITFGLAALMATTALAGTAQGATLFDQTVVTTTGTNRFFVDEDPSTGVRTYGITGDDLPDGFVTLFPNAWVRKMAELFQDPASPAVRVRLGRVTGDRPQNLRISRGRRVVLAGRDVAGRYQFDFGTTNESTGFEALFRQVVFPTPPITPHLLRDGSPAACANATCSAVSCANGTLEIPAGQCCPSCVTTTATVVFPPPIDRATFASRPCPNTALYVDVPLFEPTPWSDLSWVSSATTSFTRAAQASGFDWFCTDANGCVFPDGVDVRLEAVLPQRTVANSVRSEGHLRFLRFRFRNAATGSDLELSEGGECAAIDAAREAVYTATGISRIGVANEPPFYVGRECEASAQVVEAIPSDEMLTWHLTRMGLAETSTQVRPPLVASNLVDFALVDSGVDTVVFNAVGIVDELEFSSGGRRDPHGSIMAVLARQIAPTAAIRSYRVLGENGAGVSEAVARALDTAIFDRPDLLKPLVINLSLGFSPKLGRYNRSANGACLTDEDPYGESIRFLLYTAALLDRDATGSNPVTGRISVVSAAGNQPLRTEPELFAEGSRDDNFPCTADNGGVDLAETQFFLPAQWSRDPSCADIFAELRRLVVAVSAINSRNLPAALTTTQFNSLTPNQSEIVAFGEHVMVDLPGTARTANACTMGTDFPPPLTLPAALTGSSVSSVLTAAAMARIQDGLISSGRTPMSRAQLAGYVYLTGRTNCGPRTIDGGIVRQLDVGRADQGLTQACNGLAQCAAGLSNEFIPDLNRSVIEGCATELAACGLETFTATSGLVLTCPSGQQILPPATYTPPVCSQFSEPTPTVISAEACAGSCPNETGTDRQLLGSSGPLPSGQGCNWCYAIFDSVTQTMVGVFALNADYPPGTRFLGPVLEFEGIDVATGELTIQFLELDSVSDADAWTSGNVVRVETTLTNQLGIDLQSANVRLIYTIDSPEGGGLPAKQYAPIAWQFQ